MKLVKRKYSNPITSIPVFGIPFISYIIQKSIGVISNDKDFYWFFCISITFLGCLTINYKLTKTK